MATIAITATRTGQVIPTKTSTIADADMDALVAAYQNDANAFVGGIATYAQVLNFAILQAYNLWRARVQQANIVPAVVPPQINLS